MSSSSNSDVDEGQFLDFKILRGKCSKCKGLDVVACEDRLSKKGAQASSLQGVQRIATESDTQMLELWASLKDLNREGPIQQLGGDLVMQHKLETAIMDSSSDEVELAKVVEERVSKGYDFIARNAKRTFKEIKDGENMNVSSPSSEWSLEVEIAKVLEVGYALGYDFNGR
ncbi:hypothetical protein QYF36_009155 [Acer negundo]|nr:hypothetical protein QYF36_009155 [Acer negundo]